MKGKRSGMKRGDERRKVGEGKRGKEDRKK